MIELRQPGGRMRNRVSELLLLVALSLASVSAFGQEKKKEPDPVKIKVGDVAPDFTLLEYDGKGVKPVSLHDFKGKKNVALAFFVFAFTGG
jgi:cytochrome oxidase Cu insertion factor (SCO1/SenC/PrrC family)